MAIHFEEEDVRPMGRTAFGVKGIALGAGDEVVALEVVREGTTVLTVTENGYGKRTAIGGVPAAGPWRQGPDQHQVLGAKRAAWWGSSSSRATRA